MSLEDEKTTLRIYKPTSHFIAYRILSNSNPLSNYNPPFLRKSPKLVVLLTKNSNLGVVIRENTIIGLNSFVFVANSFKTNWTKCACLSGLMNFT
jgi:hypothetical protein